MVQEMTNFIEQLCMADGISGREEQVRERIIRRIDGHCEWKVDARGNLLCHKKGKNPAAKKVMITAHMDEAGFMLTGIRPDGLLSFANVGDLDSRVVLGKAVRIDGKTIGVIGTKPIHLQTKDEQDRPVPFDKLYIDIGASTRESAQQAVALGAQITFAGEGTAAFGDGYLTGKVDAVFTTSALTMTSGAANAAFALRPDAAIVLGTAQADDVRGGAHRCRLGGGPAICLHDATTYYDLGLYNTCVQTAQEKGLALQQLESSALKNELSLSLPCRYPYSISAMIQQEDLERTGCLLQALAAAIAG